MDPDRLVKAYNAGKSISKQGTAEGKKETRAQDLRVGWETKRLGFQFQAQDLVLILNERERGGRHNPY